MSTDVREEIFYDIRAHLRRNGITDFSKFRLHREADGASSITKWDYDIPQPNIDEVIAADSTEIFREIENVMHHNHDIYLASISFSPEFQHDPDDNYHVFTIRPLRNPCITNFDISSRNYIQFKSGYWKINMIGVISGNVTLTITKSDGVRIFTYDSHTDRVDINDILCFVNDTSIKFSIRVSGRIPAIVDFKVILERI